MSSLACGKGAASDVCLLIQGPSSKPQLGAVRSKTSPREAPRLDGAKIAPPKPIALELVETDPFAVPESRKQ